MLGILFFLINMVGAMCLLVGLLATIPTTMLAMVYVYRKLLAEEPVAAEKAELFVENISQPTA